MASFVVTGDIQGSGNTVVLSIDRNKRSATRLFSVADGASATAGEYMYDCATAVGLPAIGSVHPSTDELILRDIKVSMEPAHDNNVIAQCIYGPADIVESTTVEPEWEIEAYLAEFETSFDRNDALITTTYIPTGGSSPGVTRTGTVTTTIPTIRVRGFRIENANPYSKILTHAGTTNDAAWGPFGTTEVARSWLINIKAATADGGATYKVEYELLRLMERLDPEVRHLGDDGKPPDDISATNGVTYPEVIPQTNFALLNLT